MYTEVRRFPTNPLISPKTSSSIGTNINGPSLIRVPEWLPAPLGRYYLYFAHHQGLYIRLAYADALEGPWTVYEPGVLPLESTPCQKHIASPDVHIAHEQRRIVMYYHGPVDLTAPSRVAQAAAESQRTGAFPILGNQRSFVATSPNGIDFASDDEILGSSYFRVFRWRDHWYALGMPGIFYRSKDGFTNFEQGPILFDEHTRHTAVRLVGDTLQVFYSRAGDCPEHILLSQISLTPDWSNWCASPPQSVLLPETEYEGSHLPRIPSQRGAIHEPACQLRDPAVFEEDGRTYLLYSVAGEQGIAMAELR